MSESETKRGFNCINRLLINTGNLLASQQLKRKVTLLPSEEIIEALNLTLSNWRHAKNTAGNENVNQSVTENTLLLQNKQLLNTVNATQRQNYKIVVKLFIYNESCCVINEALDFVMKQLNIEQIDSLIVCLPPSGVKITLEQMKPIWNCVEKIVEESKVIDVGVADLDSSQLKDLYFWAKKAKPNTNQVNLDACCVIPPEMTAFANENKVKLLTHNDPRDFVPLDKFKQLITDCELSDVDNWRRDCIMRYAVMAKGKGIVENKGYILMARKIQ